MVRPHKTYSAEGVAMYWWDDAVALARQLASETGERHRVYRGKHGWTVAPVTFRPRLRVVGQMPANAWQGRAVCVDMPKAEAERVFLTDYPDSVTVSEARAICATCPVTAECLDLAMTTETYLLAKDRAGIYAGTTPRQRYGLHLAGLERPA